MHKVVVLGRGGAGKSTFARRVAAVHELPLIELDREFWNDELDVLPRDDWARRQTDLASAADRWIMDGDLGPYDEVEPRLRRADTVIILDTSLWRCVCRAVRRGPERRDFWLWTIRWRRNSRPHLLAAIATFAPHATVVTLRTPREIDRWLEQTRR